MINVVYWNKYSILVYNCDKETEYFKGILIMNIFIQNIN